MKIISPYQPEIRFADIDAMGHVNNAVYFSYFEQTRIHFFSTLIGSEWNWKRQGILVARNEIDYLLPILLNDKILISVACSNIGKKSFTLTYSIVRQTGDKKELCARGLSVLVCFDNENKMTTLIPDIWKSALEEYFPANG